MHSAIVWKKSVGFLLKTKISKAQLSTLSGKLVHIQNSSQVKTFHEEDNAIHLHFCQLHWLLREEEQTIPTIQLKDKNVEQQKPRQLSNSSLLRGVRHDCTLCTGWHKLFNNNLLCGKQTGLCTLFMPLPRASLLNTSVIQKQCLQYKR